MTMTDGSLSHHPERILEKTVQVENHMRSDRITVQHEAGNLAFGMAAWLCEGIKTLYRNAHWLL